MMPAKTHAYYWSQNREAGGYFTMFMIYQQIQLHRSATFHVLNLLVLILNITCKVGLLPFLFSCPLPFCDNDDSRDFLSIMISSLLSPPDMYVVDGWSTACLLRKGRNTRYFLLGLHFRKPCLRSNPNKEITSLNVSNDFRIIN